MSASDIELLRGAWAAFERGEVDTATEVLAPDVQWYGASDPGAEGGCHSRDEARAFIHRAVADGVRTELLDIRDAGDRYVLILQPHRPPESGEPMGPHGEVVTVRDGRVTEMVVYPTVADALSAAGLSA
jgi:ketosteroid isomerase-like protein